MARFCKRFVIAFLPFYLFLLSCQEGGEAGDLFGMWRLEGSDSKSVSFSGSVTLFRDADGSQVFGKFNHNGDSLFIECVSIEGMPSDTIFIEEGFGFKPFTNIRMKIERLDSDDLVLSKDGHIWSFYKY